MNACPHNAIEIRENENGFLRPVIDGALCVDCGICEKTCPLITKVPFDERQLEQPVVYAAYNLDEEIRLQSSSGGIFDILAREILAEGGVVFGAAFEEDFSVSQKGVTGTEQLEPLRFSKYVQSDTKNTFSEVKEHLKSGRKVLYVGTPCMIGGLIGFLKERDENLYTCSFICGSVPSRKVWRLYTAHKAAQYGGEIKSICFRDKRKGWLFPSVVMSFGEKEYASNKDWFKGGMANKFFINDACLYCQFKGINQLADMMVADFWGIEKIRPELAADQKGVSAVLIHTERGQELFDRCKKRMYYEEAPLDLVVQVNRGIVGTGVSHKKRAALLEDLDRLPMQTLMRKYPTQKSVIQRIFGKGRRILGKGLHLIRRRFQI